MSVQCTPLCQWLCTGAFTVFLCLTLRRCATEGPLENQLRGWEFVHPRKSPALSPEGIAPSEHAFWPNPFHLGCSRLGANPRLWAHGGLCWQQGLYIHVQLFSVRRRGRRAVLPTPEMSGFPWPRCGDNGFLFSYRLGVACGIPCRCRYLLPFTRPDPSVGRISSPPRAPSPFPTQGPSCLARSTHSDGSCWRFSTLSLIIDFNIVILLISQTMSLTPGKLWDGCLKAI